MLLFLCFGSLFAVCMLRLLVVSVSGFVCCCLFVCFVVCVVCVVLFVFGVCLFVVCLLFV